tara:strand:- start:244 stop:708 length:465 start_codon:yes stop_codon:yes gene_type:complete
MTPTFQPTYFQEDSYPTGYPTSAAPMTSRPTIRPTRAPVSYPTRYPTSVPTVNEMMINKVNESNNNNTIIFIVILLILVVSIIYKSRHKIINMNLSSNKIIVDNNTPINDTEELPQAILVRPDETTCVVETAAVICVETQNSNTPIESIYVNSV